MLPPNQGDDPFTPSSSFVTMAARTKEQPSSSLPPSAPSSPLSSTSPAPSSFSSSPSTPNPLPKPVVKRKIPYFTSQEVRSHTKSKDIWVIMNGAVYDITQFLPNHPGGEEVILEYAGKDITEAFRSPNIHSHSDYAFQVLKPHRIGTVDNLEGEDDIFDQENEFSHIIDLDKAIINQMWSKRLPLDVYLKLAHTPHFIKDGGIARLFENDFLEQCSRNDWWAVLVWVPVIMYLFSLTLPHKGILLTSIYFVEGIGIWSLIEYLMHRYLFHMDGFLPDHHFFICIHFLIHGIHHFLPMDRMRLVMPPSLTLMILGFFMLLFHTFFSTHVANALVSGGLFGYMVYDLTHYFLHHVTPKTSYLKDLKTYHLNHHYRNYHLGYGVSSKVWDYIFGTVLKD